MAEATDCEPVSKRLRSKSSDVEEVETVPEEEIESLQELEGETEAELEDGERFVSPKKPLQTYQGGFIPKNTAVNMKRAVKNFINWKASYNGRHPEDPCPDDVLLSDNPTELSLWLQRYILGTRKKDGTSYPPKTLYLLLCGLYRYMKENKERTGHTSLDGLRKCEHISERQREEACKALRVVPQSVKEHTSVTTSSQVLNLECSSRSVVPTFSFGSASLNGCTINVYQGPYNPTPDHQE
uniref:DUF3504 domain-containing protein n=1 Tax=Amphimedon queenslandica TaxID=400682 RepID=A0A1X7TZ09_AMPQE